MQISDALPVQFWLIGCATYNEHQAPGVFHKCWCAPWECGDEIKVQFTDDPSQSFSLEIYDLNDSPLDSINFEETYVGVYEASLNLSQDSPDICDQQIKLKIKRDAGLQGISLPALSSWLTSTIGANVDWSVGGATPNVSLPGTIFVTVDSEFLYVDYAFIPGVTYNISLDFTRALNSGSNNNPRNATLDITDNAFAVQFTSLIAATLGSNTITISFTATSSTTRIAFWFNSGSDMTITVTGVSGQRTVGDSEIVAQSDCLDIRQSHNESILLTFSNHRNFAGLVYQNTSPNTEFTIRVPAIFFHQRFPEEDEVMELSSELITLNGTVRKQRRLDMDYVPYYFHEKMKLILKHQFLQIFNREWVKQEAYEITEGNRLAPLKSAKCWLSEKDFVHRNIL
jgi:hypothetical protein